MSPEDVDRARAWRAEDPPVSLRECARRLGVKSPNTVRRNVDPVAHEKAKADNSSWYAANREKAVADATAWRAANPQRAVANAAAWHAANMRRENARNAAWRAANPGYGAAWATANPEKCRLRTSRRRARKMGAPGKSYTSEETTWLLERVFTGQQCAYCQRYAAALEWDHVHPLARGGTNEPENLVAACKRCNTSKGAKTLAEWRDGAHQHVAQVAIDAANLVREVFVAKK